MFSGGGSSFRGKDYNNLGVDITGVSLYEFWIPPEEVERMYLFFKALDTSEIEGYADKDDHVPSEVISLEKFFKICSEHGLGAIGWW